MNRRARTCFVGNLALSVNAKKLKKLFSKFGKVEKVWFRSVATQLESKIPARAQIIKGDLGDQKDNKNAYVLFTKKEDAVDAKTNLNQTVIDDKHIRVDIDLKEERLQNDYDCTIFIGNLPF